MMAVFPVIIIAMYIKDRGSTDFPANYVMSFLCCITGFFLCRFFASIPVPSFKFADIWSASKAVLDGVWRAKNKAWDYVLGIESEV